MGWKINLGGQPDDTSSSGSSSTQAVTKPEENTESDTEKVIKALTGKKLDFAESQAEAADRYNPYSSNPEVARLQRQRDIILNSSNANDPRAKSGLAEIDKLIGQAEQKARIEKLPKNIVTGNTQFLSPLTPFEDIGKDVIPQSAITPMANGYDGSGMYAPYNTDVEAFKNVEPRFEAGFDEALERALRQPEEAPAEQAPAERTSPRDIYGRDWFDSVYEYGKQLAEQKGLKRGTDEYDQAILDHINSNIRWQANDLGMEYVPATKEDLPYGELGTINKDIRRAEGSEKDDLVARRAELHDALGIPTFGERLGLVGTAGGTGALAGYTDAARALYASGQERRTAETEAKIAELEKALEDEYRQRDADEADYRAKYFVNGVDTGPGLENWLTVHDNYIEYYQRQLDAYRKVIPAQEGATEATAEIADELQQKSAEATKKAKTDLNGVERFLVDMGVQGVQMLSDAAVNIAIGTPQSLIPIFARSFGSGTQAARQAGASTDQQILYGAAVGAVEALTEKMFDGLSGLYGKGLADEALDLTNIIIDKVAKESSPAAKRALLLFLGGAGEAVEEGVSGRLDPWLKAIYDNGEELKETYGSVENWLNSWADTGYEMLVAYAMGFAGSTVGVNSKLNEYESWAGNTPVEVPSAVEAPAEVPADILAQQTAPTVNTPAEVTAENAPSVTPESVAEAFVPSEAPVEQTSIDASNVSEETGVNIPAEQSASETQNNAENEGTVTRAEPAPTEPTGVMKRSQVESNTLQHLAEETGGQQGELYYPSYTEKQTLAAAQSRVSQDFTGEMNTLTDKASWSSTDVDSAFLIQGILQTDGVKTGDFSAAQAWSKVVKDRISRSAQALQAVAKWSRTGEAVFTNAIEEMAKTGLSTEEQGRVLTDIEKFAKRYDETTLRNGDRTALDDKEIRQLILDMNAYRKTGTFGKGNFEKVLSQIKDVDWLHEFALRQLMAIPADYTVNPSLAQQLKTWQVNSQLSRLGTFFRNIGGNLAFGVQDTLAQDAFGIAIDSLVSKATGVREVGLDKGWLSSKARQGARDAMLKSILEVSADVDMAGEGSKYGNNTNRTNKMTGSGFSRFMSRWEQLLGYSLTTSDRTSRGQIEEAVSEGVMNANRGLTGVNNFVADQVINDNNLANAFTEATGVQLTGDRKIDRGLIKENASQLLNIGDLSAVPYGNALLDTIMQNQMTTDRASVIADQSADYRLFQNRGTAVKISKGLHDVLNYIGVKDANGNSFGLGDLINAYPGVPANLAVKSLEYSPANIVKGGIELVKLLSDVKHGVEVDVGRQHQAVMDIARGLSGVPAIALLTALFRSGAVKNADDEKDLDASSQKAAEGRTGVQVNLSAAMRLLKGESGEWRDGDDLMSIGYLEPLNAFMAIASLVAEDTEEDPTLKSFAKSTYNHYIEGSIQSILDMPVMSNISSLIDTFKYSTAETIGEKAVEGTIEFAGNALSGMIPAPVSQLAKATDDTMRSTKGDTKLESVVNGILSNIPGLRQTLDPKLDAFGQEKKYAGTDLQRWLNTFVLPGSISEMNQTETGRLIERLYEDTGDPSVYPDRKAPKSFTASGEKIKLNTEQQFQYQTVYGQTAAQLVTDFMNGEGYEDMTPEQRVEIVNKLYDFAQNDAENAILEAAGMEPKGNSEYEKAKAVMDAAGMSWGDFFSFDANVPKKYEDLARFLLDSDFTDEQQEALYDIYNTSKTPFSTFREKEQAAKDAGFESADVFEAMLADVKAFKKNVKNEYDSNGNVEAAEYIRDQDLTDEQKDTLIGEVSKDLKGFYDIARENDVGANDTIDLLLAIDATPAKGSTQNNGSISQKEMIAYYYEHPEDEWLISMFWNSKNFSMGDWDTAKGKNFK